MHLPETGRPDLPGRHAVSEGEVRAGGWRDVCPHPLPIDKSLNCETQCIEWQVVREPAKQKFSHSRRVLVCVNATPFYIVLHILA